MPGNRLEANAWTGYRQGKDADNEDKFDIAVRHESNWDQQHAETGCWDSERRH